MHRQDTTRLIKLLADDQYGLVEVRQLRARKVTVDAIRARRDSQLLLPYRYRGVYAVGHAPRTAEAELMAAVLAVGEGARLSHATASARHRLERLSWPPIHVTADRAAASGRRGIVLHRSLIDPADAAWSGALPVTSLPRTLIDEAAHRPPPELVRLVERVPNIDARTMRRALARNAGRPGAGRMDVVLRAYEDQTRSYLERAFLALCRRHGLPKPSVNVAIATRQRDFSWPEARLVVETDGHAFHVTRAQRADDAKRDRELLLAGWRPARFTYEQVLLDPDGTAAEVHALLRVVS